MVIVLAMKPLDRKHEKRQPVLRWRPSSRLLRFLTPARRITSDHADASSSAMFCGTGARGRDIKPVHWDGAAIAAANTQFTPR